MEEEYVPLSKRPSAELRAKAVAFRQMAEATRAVDTKESLMKLALRLDALAKQREREDR